MERAHLAQIPNLTPVPAARNSLPPDCTTAAPYQVERVPSEPNRATTPGVGFAWGGLKMPRQWCFHVGCGFSCVQGRTKGRGSQNLGTRNLVPTAEGHPVGVSGQSWARFTVWTPEQPHVVPRSIPEVGDPKLGAAVRSGVSGWQNLYLEHIGSDRRIFSEEVDPKSSPTHHRGPCEVLSSKSSWCRSLLN